MNNFFSVLLSILLVAAYQKVHAQTNIFEVRVSNRAIGTIEAYRQMNGFIKSIVIKTRIQVMLSKIYSDITNEYYNNILTAASASRVSGQPRKNKQTTIRREGKNYVIIVNGERSIIDADIKECVADLYFMEPKKLSRVFSETLGSFLPLKPIGGGVYELTLPEGKKNVFKYENGQLVSVEVYHAFGKAFFIKIS